MLWEIIKQRKERKVMCGGEKVHVRKGERMLLVCVSTLDDGAEFRGV